MMLANGQRDLGDSLLDYLLDSLQDLVLIQRLGIGIEVVKHEHHEYGANEHRYGPEEPEE